MFDIIPYRWVRLTVYSILLDVYSWFANMMLLCIGMPGQILAVRSGRLDWLATILIIRCFSIDPVSLVGRSFRKIVRVIVYHHASIFVCIFIYKPNSKPDGYR